MLWNLSRKALIHPTQIFNHILRYGYFPYAWKSAKVILFLKPGKPLSDTGTHKPSSPFSTVSTLLEQVVAHRLLFIRINFYHRKNLSSQLSRITDFITHGFNLRKHTGMFLLDIEKVYDTEWINELLFKLI